MAEIYQLCFTCLGNPEQWGGCPKCHRNDGFRDIEGPDGFEHWFICHRHKKKWCVGINLFSGTAYFLEVEPEETEKRLIKNRMFLERHHTVEPWYPTQIVFRECQRHRQERERVYSA